MKAIYPGSFDPFTLGHKAMVDKALKMFDAVVIAIGINDKKSNFLPLEKRLEMIRRIYEGNSKIEIISYRGLTVDYCTQHEIGVIIRGVRNFLDYEFERSISNVNHTLSDQVETILIMTPPELSDISSSVVREFLFHGKSPMHFLPEEFNLEDFGL
ncbi:MAG: pantetheine-phosphate adenylyltransferase [Rikenellaceae bacterium]